MEHCSLSGMSYYFVRAAAKETELNRPVHYVRKSACPKSDARRQARHTGDLRHSNLHVAGESAPGL